MKHQEITCPYSGTPTHPYIASLPMKPTAYAQFERLSEGHEDVKMLGVDRSAADVWTVFVACVSKNGKDLLESNW
jgi:hypothetical protein